MLRDLRTGAGRKRQTYRILEWLNRKGITQESIAVELGVHPSLISGTIRGVKNNRRVLRVLVERGCPAKFLSLPKDMAQQAA